MRTGQLEEAEAAVATARARFERSGSWMGLILADVAAASVARRRGEPRTAVTLAGSAVDRYRAGSAQHAPEQLLAICLATLASARVDAGDHETARADLVDAQEAAVRSTDMPVLALVAVGWSVLALADGDLPGAAELLGLADVVRGSADPTDPDVVRVEEAVAAARGSAPSEDGDADERRRAAAGLVREEAVRALAQVPDRAPRSGTLLVG